MKKLSINIFLVLAFSVSAFGAEVPSDVTVQNLNGSQQYIETFTVPKEIDPETLKIEPFEYEGYTYTFATITEKENHFEDMKEHTETVTIETAKKDLSVVLETLAPIYEYDDGTHKGTLYLDHSSIVTEAAGYVSKSSNVSTTKTYDNLAYNDMSLIPATTVKDGLTLNLANVDWQMQATTLVDGVLAPSQYMAVATYSGTSWYSLATGYITTADYVGEISSSGVENVTYTLTYLGEANPKISLAFLSDVFTNPVIAISIISGVIGLIVLIVLLILSKRENMYLRMAWQEEIFEEENDYDGEELS